MNKDLISRSALFKDWDALDETQDPNLLVDAMIKATQEAPSWTRNPVCKARTSIFSGTKCYCPNCGAKMDAEVNDDAE